MVTHSKIVFVTPLAPLGEGHSEIVVAGIVSTLRPLSSIETLHVLGVSMACKA